MPPLQPPRVFLTRPRPRRCQFDRTGGHLRDGISTDAYWRPTSLSLALPEIHVPRVAAAGPIVLRIQSETTTVVVCLDTRLGGRPHQAAPMGYPLDTAPRVLPMLLEKRSAAGQPAKPFVKHLEHLDYLKRVSTEGNPPPITLGTATSARRAWQAIWQASGFSMPVPAACTGPDGEMFYSWDRGRHHLELEIIPGQPS